MEDDRIKDLFQSFKPELSSGRHFMAQLQRNMEAVELVKLHNAEEWRRTRLAVVIAALSGFVAGVALMLVYPSICAWLSAIKISLPSIGIPEISIDGQIASWLLIGVICVSIALNAYDLALSRLTLNKH